MADVNKNFSKPEEYGPVLQRLAQRNIYAITSFIFGMDNDTVWRSVTDAERDRKLATRVASVWTADALPGDAALRPLTKSRTSCAPETLARLCAFRNGTQPTQDDD